MKKLITNASTNKTIEVEMTTQEIDELIEENKRVEKVNAEFLANKAALLQKLGITEEEARLLLGGN